MSTPPINTAPWFPTTQPERSRWRHVGWVLLGLWMVGSAVLLVFALHLLRAPEHGANAAFNDYRSAMVAGDWVRAYSDLSPEIRRGTSVVDFSVMEHRWVTQHGKLLGMTKMGQSVGDRPGAGWTAELTVRQTYEHSTIVFSYVLHQEQGHWYIAGFHAR